MRIATWPKWRLRFLLDKKWAAEEIERLKNITEVGFYQWRLLERMEGGGLSDPRIFGLEGLRLMEDEENPDNRGVSLKSLRVVAPANLLLREPKL